MQNCLPDHVQDMVVEDIAAWADHSDGEFILQVAVERHERNSPAPRRLVLTRVLHFRTQEELERFRQASVNGLRGTRYTFGAFQWHENIRPDEAQDVMLDHLRDYPSTKGGTRHLDVTICERSTGLPILHRHIASLFHFDLQQLMRDCMLTFIDGAYEFNAMAG